MNTAVSMEKNEILQWILWRIASKITTVLKVRFETLMNRKLPEYDFPVPQVSHVPSRLKRCVKLMRSRVGKVELTARPPCPEPLHSRSATTYSPRAQAGFFNDVFPPTKFTQLSKAASPSSPGCGQSGPTRRRCRSKLSPSRCAARRAFQEHTRVFERSS